MRLKLIACKALTRELSYLTALSKNCIDVTFVRQGYHVTPELLRKVLQQEIDSVESGRDAHTNAFGDDRESLNTGGNEDFDAILIGYGLCSNGIVGLRSKNHTLVIPRGHDCITFFLGSKERYAEYFRTLPGCYWYTASWIENSDLPNEESTRRATERYRKMGYDDDDIEFLLEELQGWTKNYKNAGYIRMPFFDKPELQQFTKDAAGHFGWKYNLVEGDMSLLERFLAGDWDAKDFLVVPPGCEVVASYDENIISYRECASNE